MRQIQLLLDLLRLQRMLLHKRTAEREFGGEGLLV
jgi:hypothetical protein